MGNGRRGKGEKGLSVAGINYAQAYDPTGWADDIYNQPIQAFNYTLSSRSRISVPRGQEHTHTHTDRQRSDKTTQILLDKFSTV